MFTYFGGSVGNTGRGAVIPLGSIARALAGYEGFAEPVALVTNVGLPYQGGWCFGDRPWSSSSSSQSNGVGVGVGLGVEEVVVSQSQGEEVGIDSIEDVGIDNIDEVVFLEKLENVLHDAVLELAGLDDIDGCAVTVMVSVGEGPYG